MDSSVGQEVGMDNSFLKVSNEPDQCIQWKLKIWGWTSVCVVKNTRNIIHVSRVTGSSER